MCVCSGVCVCVCVFRCVRVCLCCMCCVSYSFVQFKLVVFHMYNVDMSRTMLMYCDAQLYHARHVLIHAHVCIMCVDCRVILDACC